LSNEILSNNSNHIDEVSVSKLVFLRELDDFSDDLELLSKMNQEIKSQNDNLLSELKEIRDSLMKEYDLNDSEIMKYRKENQDGRKISTLFRVKREYSTVKPHLGR
jgi:hypothetical protein